MLQQQTQESIQAKTRQQPQERESMRVTPQEFAQAVAALEGRREAETQQNENTIDLAEAVSQTGLNIPVEDLRAEVEAIRAAGAAAQQRQQNRRRYRKRVGAALALLCCLGLGVWVSLHFTTHAKPSISLPAIVKLSAVPDNWPVHVDPDTLKKLSLGAKQEDIMVDGRANTGATSMFAVEWTIIKSGGHLYVRAWAPPDAALAAKSNKQALVYNSKDDAPNVFLEVPAASLMQIELPIYRFASGYQDEAPSGLFSDITATAYESSHAVNNIVSRFSSDLNDFNSQDVFEYVVKNDRIEISGRVRNAAIKQKITDKLNEIVQRLGLPYTVTNAMTYPK